MEQLSLLRKEQRIPSWVSSWNRSGSILGEAGPPALFRHSGEPLRSELSLRFINPAVVSGKGGDLCAEADAEMAFGSADPTHPCVKSRHFKLVVPLWSKKENQLHRYLECSHLWPAGVFRELSPDDEESLMNWGIQLFKATFRAKTALGALNAWRSASSGQERRFSLEVDIEGLKGASEEVRQAGKAAAAEILVLPWELLHDGGAWLFQGERPVTVRRALPERQTQPARLSRAAEAYLARIERARHLADRRKEAIAQGQLGVVLMLQEQYFQADEAHRRALYAFEALGEMGKVATAWHHIGTTRLKLGDFNAADKAYRRALAIGARNEHLPLRAATFNQLGNLYYTQGRLEEAGHFYGRAAMTHRRLKDLSNEGRDRNNLAATLIELGRLDEARAEIERAIECKKHDGRGTQIWKSWSLLEDLERATGHPAAALAARKQAIKSFF